MSRAAAGCPTVFIRVDRVSDDDGILRFVARTDGPGTTTVLEQAAGVVVIDPFGAAAVAGAVDSEGRTPNRVHVLLSVGSDSAIDGAVRLGIGLSRRPTPPRTTVWCPPDAGGALPTFDSEASEMDVRPAGTGLLFEIGSCAVRAYSTSHTIESRGYIVQPCDPDPGPDAVRATLVHAGLTRPCYATVEAARGAQLLVHDANFFGAAAGEADRLGHSTAAEAARVAGAAGVGELLMRPCRALTRADADRMEQEAGRLFRPASVVGDGMSFGLTCGAITGSVRAGGV